MASDGEKTSLVTCHKSYYLHYFGCGYAAQGIMFNKYFTINSDHGKGKIQKIFNREGFL